MVTLPTEAASRRFALSVIIACVPAFAAGFLLHDFIKTYLFGSLTLICWSLVIGGVVLLLYLPIFYYPTKEDGRATGSGGRALSRCRGARGSRRR